MGKYIYYAVIAFVVGIIGMMLFPTSKSVIGAADTTDFTSLESVGMVLLGYALLGVTVYIIIKHVKGSS